MHSERATQKVFDINSMASSQEENVRIPSSKVCQMAEKVAAMTMGEK